jgi:hypothetical protein
MIPFAIVLVLLWILLIASVRGIKIRLLLIAIPVAACAPIASCVIQTATFAAESAEVVVPNSGSSLKLEFDGGWDEPNAKGYLIFKNGVGEVRKKMEGSYDWVHWPRTSIYLMDDGRVSVLGTSFDDYVIDPKNLSIEVLPPTTPSNSWIYFGAFDFAEKYSGLMFIPASEERECTATRLNAESSSKMVYTRPQGRRERCNRDELKN